MVRPVSNEFEVSQTFGSYPTAGVAGNWNGTTVQRLVAQYGDYQSYGHAGEDIACPMGTPVRSIADGVVVWADWGTNLPGDNSDWGYRQRWYLYKSFPGIVTVIQHDGWFSVYGHLSTNDHAPRGTRVVAGQVIGLSGNTGGVAPHLHVAAIVDTSYRTGGGLIYGCADPAPFYDKYPSKAGENMASDEWYQNMIDAQARIDKRTLDMYNRLFGRDQQRYFHPTTLEVRNEPFPGAVAARSTDVHDTISSNNLLVSQIRDVISAVRTIPGADTAAIEALGQKFEERLQKFEEGIRGTLSAAKEGN